MMTSYLIGSKHKAKSLDYEMFVTVTYKNIRSPTVCELKKDPKYDAYLLDRDRDIRQNHGTMKYRSQ